MRTYHLMFSLESVEIFQKFPSTTDLCQIMTLIFRKLFFVVFRTYSFYLLKSHGEAQVQIGIVHIIEIFL